MPGLLFLLVFLIFYRLPLLAQFLFRIYGFTAEHMGVTADHFGGNGFNYLKEGKELFFLVEIVEKNNLKKEIPQFLADVVGVVVVDCLDQFVGFFDKILFKGLGGLFFIPGASIRRSETVDDLKEGKEFFRSAYHGPACVRLKEKMG